MPVERENAEPTQEKKRARTTTRQPTHGAARTAPRKQAPTGGEGLEGRLVADKYLVLGVLGQGGMGTVYEAENRATGRRVAVKVLKPGHAEKADSGERMRREARVVGQIQHPNICEIVDIGEMPDASPFLVMELLRGETLAQRLAKRGIMAASDLIPVAVQVLDALEAAHRKSIIHRDMKPDNIFLVEGERGVVAKILDFGISKKTALDERPNDLTRTGMVMGTPYYMAPEQAMGERKLDGRVDVWGMGVVLYEALAGIRPFVAKNYNALLVQILTATPVALQRANPSVSLELAALVRRALEKKREDRFQTAAALRDALVPIGRLAGPPQRNQGRSGLPKITVFGAEDSSMGLADEEPTHVITPPRDRAVQSQASTEEEVTYVDTELTVVDDPPSFLDSDHGHGVRKRR